MLGESAQAVGFNGKTAAEYAEEVKADGYTMLSGFISLESIDAMRISMQPFLDTRITKGNPDRGPGRFYITPPFQMPFADQDIFAHPFLLSVVEHLVGSDAVMCQWATDTPVKGSEYQPIHRDAKGLFFEQRGYAETPVYQLAVNFPLCDILTTDIGPLEISKGTHLLTSHEQDKLIADNQVHIEPLFMRKGDVLIRDVRGLHRGTPNVTDTPRVMVVIGYSRSWLRRPEVGIDIPRDVHSSLSEVSKRLLRFENVVDTVSYDGTEIYDASELNRTSGTAIS